MLPLLALKNKVLFGVRNRLRITRKNYKEKPALVLKTTPERLKIIERLKANYKVSFESFLKNGNALENYHILHLLDEVKTKWKWKIPQHKNVTDVGSKNFYYAPTLNIVFKPESLTGIELDAYGLYEDFHTRFSYAHYYLNGIKNGRYLPVSFFDFNEQTDILTLFYPFVISEPLVRWGLPMSEFKPQDFFNHAYQTVNRGGQLFMVNQGPEEIEAAMGFAAKAGFKLLGSHRLKKPLLTRSILPEISLWEK